MTYTHPIEWLKEYSLVPYMKSISFMEQKILDIHSNNSTELVWVLEHPPLLTAGTSATLAEEPLKKTIPIYNTGRGGKYTYHGPGQRVVYPMLNLKTRFNSDVRSYVRFLEEWIIQTLNYFGVQGLRRPERVGVWVARPDKGIGFEDKIAAIGVRVRHHITMHGFALNYACDLEPYRQFVPCGISQPQYFVTSLQDLGIQTTAQELDGVLTAVFGNLILELKNIVSV